MTILYYVLGYFAVGLIAYILMELLANRRVTRNLDVATSETFQKLNANGNPVSPRGARVALIGAMLLFWPAAVIGMLTSGGKSAGTKVNDDSK